MIAINEHSGIYTLEVAQHLPVSKEKAWEFLSSPSNLSKITPSHMNFKITSRTMGRMYAGQIISYRIKVAPLVYTSWVTEITHIVDQSYFVDEQRIGPYRLWHHEHHLLEDDLGVKVIDKVSYKLPLGFFGHIAHKLFIKRMLFKIFNHRFIALQNEFQENDRYS